MKLLLIILIPSILISCPVREFQDGLLKFMETLEEDVTEKYLVDQINRDIYHGSIITIQAIRLKVLIDMFDHDNEVISKKSNNPR
jgi:hypothetical protein